MPETLPLFPLGTVLLPGASLPLHVFEPRYRQLTVDLVTGAVAGKTFGVIAIKQGHPATADAGELVHDVGCAALLREARRLPDGRFDIITRGERRFRLLDVRSAQAPYLVGTVEWLPDAEPSDDERALLPALAYSARRAHRDYCIAAWRHEDWDEPAATVEPEALPHVLAADCLLALEDKQALLEERCPVGRLRLVRKLMVREAGFLRTLRAVPVPMHQYTVDTSDN